MAQKIEYQLNINHRGVKIESSPVHFARLTPCDVPLLYRIRHKLSGTRTLNSVNFSVMLDNGVGHLSIYRKIAKIDLFLGVLAFCSVVCISRLSSFQV